MLRHNLRDRTTHTHRPQGASQYVARTCSLSVKGRDGGLLTYWRRKPSGMWDGGTGTGCVDVQGTDVEDSESRSPFSPNIHVMGGSVGAYDKPPVDVAHGGTDLFQHAKFFCGSAGLGTFGLPSGRRTPSRIYISHFRVFVCASPHLAPSSRSFAIVLNPRKYACLASFARLSKGYCLRERRKAVSNAATLHDVWV